MTKTFFYKKRKDILDIHEHLSSAKNLKPSAKVNSNFKKLVTIVRNTSADYANHILNDANIRNIQDSLRKISSKGESELEMFWAKRILASNKSEEELCLFPYYTNYKKMTRLEVREMNQCRAHKTHKVLFIGSGPLPLSSIMMTQEYGINVDNLDRSKTACKISTKIINTLKLSDKIKVINKDILSISDFSKYDTVFIAALVGKDDEEKGKIINHVVTNTKKHTHIIMRSVNNLGSLLYPQITPSHLRNIQVIHISQSPKDIINNIIIGKKK